MPLSFRHALINRGAPCPIYQATLGAPSTQGCALHPGARPPPRGTPSTQGRALHPGARPPTRGAPISHAPFSQAPFPINQTACQELGVNGGRAKTWSSEGHVHNSGAHFLHVCSKPRHCWSHVALTEIRAWRDWMGTHTLQ